MRRSNWLTPLAALLAPSQAVAQSDCSSDVTNGQAVSTFSLLLDGQPGTYQQPQLSVVASGGSGTEQVGATFGVTPGSGPVLCNALLEVGTPGFTFTGGRAAYDHNFDVAWLQRWRADDRNGPTLSTLLSVEIPIDNSQERVQLTLTGVAARTFGSGTVYVNILVSTPDGITLNGWGVGGLVGWKQNLRGGSSLIIDGGVQPGGARVLELAWQRPIGSHFILGPGVSLSRSGGQTEITFGISLLTVFGGNWR